MAVKPTDKHIGNGIFLAYGAYSTKSPAKFERTRDTLTLINRSKHLFEKILTLPPDIHFRVCQFKGRTLGRYHCESRTVEIKDGMAWFRALKVLSHELIHAEQYHTGRLEKKWTSKNGWIHYWYGSPSFNKGSTYQSYLKQPWEKEAFGREEEIAKIIMNELEKIYGK